MARATQVVFLVAITATLASCGGGGRSVSRGATATAFSTGPVYEACMRAGRKDASTARCGCVQASADGVLSSSDQKRAAKFFKDPHHAQEIRQSDNPLHEAFWKRYRNFATTAEQVCA
ncbi:arginine transporter [Celeribacter sp.]|uniref:arginine transporter n=1 Tax=Celeribacter sp. TaxID=1890673 RepID=UPI003A92764C